MKKITAVIIICLIATFSALAQESKPNRPQEPQEPFPYYSEDVVFENSRVGIHLAGTLTLPQQEGNFPAVILISGSGPQNRNEELAGHKPFLVLSDYLTRNGIAVLRFDDRGTASSEGDFDSVTSADLATDVESALDYLKTRKEINPQKIGLIGHSEGGLIAPMVAANSKDVAFIVMLAGPGIPGDQILLKQQRLIAKVSGTDKEEIKATERLNRKIYGVVKTNKNPANLRTELRMSLESFLSKNPDFKITDELTEDEFITSILNTYATPWMRYFINYNPASTLKKVSIPVLALNGEKDLQVTPKENLRAIKKALRKNKNVTVKELPRLNHLFQEAITGAPSEYPLIEQTYSPAMLGEVLNWLKLQIN